jgi:transcriptional regulator with XRE-family HTH domain
MSGNTIGLGCGRFVRSPFVFAGDIAPEGGQKAARPSVFSFGVDPSRRILSEKEIEIDGEKMQGGENMLPNLKKLRQEYGISQQRLAEAIWVSQPSINKYENQTSEPDIDVLKRLADYFDTSIDYIVGRTQVRRRIEPTEAHHLNAEEARMLEGYRNLTDEERRCIDMTIRTFRK